MKHRLELFSDAVLAIIITIMVLDLHTPATGGWQAFLPTLPAIGAYAVGFITMVGFWVVHASFFARVEEITRAMMWLNFAFLFLASLMPFLIRNLAEYPGDRADTIVFLTLAYLTIRRSLSSAWLHTRSTIRVLTSQNGTAREIVRSALAGS